jgi:hypothetical protein
MAESRKSPHGAAARIVDPGRSRTGARGRRRRMGSWRLAAAVAGGAALALAPVARAETISYTVSETVPITTTTDNPCTGEPVVLSGSYHFTSRYSATVDSTGTKFHSVATKKLSLSGYAPGSGARYRNEQQEVSEENGTFSLGLDGLAPYERTDKATMLLIRQGESLRPDDFLVHFIAHITYNANGVITIQRAELDTDCR